MAVLTKRCGGYICGLVLFVIGTAAFVTGFATSRWGRYAVSVSSSGRVFEAKGYSGLWTVCSETPLGNTHCTDYPTVSDWMMSVRGLQCSALSIMFLSLCYGVAVNCLLDNAKFLRVLEVGTGISGVLGLVGAMVFAAKAESDVNNVGKLVPQVNMYFSVGWSFGVNVGGAVVILLSSALIACFNKPIDPLASANSPGMVFSTINAGAPAVGGGVGATAPVPMGNNPYVTPAYSYPPPAYPTLQGQDQGLVQPAVMTMPNSPTKY